MNASEARLPTDGFRNANVGQGLLFQQGNDGVSGARAPMPRREPAGAAPTPGPQASAPLPPLASRDEGKRPAKSAAAPGFSF
jgi:pilus assembly protein CpaC